MLNSLHPGQFLVFTLAGWINRHQQAVVDYLREVSTKWRFAGRREAGRLERKRSGSRKRAGLGGRIS